MNKDKEVWPLIQKLQKIPIQTILPEIEEEGKTYWNLEQSQKQEPDSYEIDQFQSISSSGRIYPLKIPHGEDNNFIQKDQELLKC